MLHGDISARLSGGGDGGDGGAEQGSLLEGFEDNNLSGYSGDTGKVSVESGTTIEGSYALYASPDTSFAYLANTSGATIEQGDSLDVYLYPSGSLGDAAYGILFGAQDEANAYFIRIRPDTGDFACDVRSGGSNSRLWTESASFSADTWYRLRVDWATDGTLSGTLYETAGTTDPSDDTQVASNSGVIDTTYTSGGYGWFADTGSNDSGYLDALYHTDVASSPYTTIDGFESGDLSAYTGDTGAFDTASGPTVDDGTYTLYVPMNTSFAHIVNTTDETTQQGDTLEAFVAASGEFADSAVGFMFGTQGTDNSYTIRIRPDSNDMTCDVRSGGTNSRLWTESVTITDGIWYRLRVEWQSDGTIAGSLYDANGTADPSDDTQVASNPGVVDTTYSSGGYGWLADMGSNDEGWADLLRFDDSE